MAARAGQMPTNSVAGVWPACTTPASRLDTLWSRVNLS